jgi:cytoskeletal protein CcmA (bactofilin family)
MFRRKKNDGEDDKGSPDVPEELGIPMKPGNAVKRPIGATAPTRPPTAPTRPLEMTRPIDPSPRQPAGAPRYEPIRRVAEAPAAPPPPPPEPVAPPVAVAPPPVPAPAAAPPPIVAPEPEVDMRRLIVGREISLSGEITSCDRLVVEGSVEANLANCRDIIIAEGGLFKGSASIEEAEIRGRFEGTLNVRRRLLIHATGRVVGTVHYGQIEIECGGQISGEIQAQPADEKPRVEKPIIERAIGDRPTFDRPMSTQSPILVTMAGEAKH